MTMPDYTKIGEITIVVFKDGKCPARVEGINEPLFIKVMAAQIFRIAMEVVKNGGIEEGNMLKELSGKINVIADNLSKKLKEEKPLILAPDLTGGKYS